jgi:glycosyltransferase involved in cell wall biosynthesis
MLGGAVTLARRFMADNETPDLLLATDMLDAATFLALTRARTAHLPLALYFHENQLTYPLAPQQKRDKGLAFKHLTGALCAEAVFFNSAFHLEEFFAELPRLLKHYPDHNELDLLPALRAKSQVLPVGVDFARLDPFRQPKDWSAPPLILWNHRWDVDKDPQSFAQALLTLHAEGLDFRVALLGQNFRQNPHEFLTLRETLGAKVVAYGYQARLADYARWLWTATVVVSTAKQDFFGVSMAEAIYCGAYPLLVDALNYPSLIPSAYHRAHLFPRGELLPALRQVVQARPRPAPALAQAIEAYAWPRLAPRYDDLLAGLVVK